MIVRSYAWVFSVSVCLYAGCGDDDGSETGASVSTSADSTGPDDSTSSGPTSAATDGDTSSASDASTETSGGDSSDGDSAATTGSATEDSTTGARVDFESFLLSQAAGPCVPDMDCDGFVELLGSGLLRVETFGDVSKQVTEVEISDEDFAAAVAVFTDPALLALLDGADPICDPPTDVFESMEVELDGSVHDATTTACDQAPIAAARAKADELVTEYVP